ncbi:MAG: hypothetical protein P8129_05015 [Anaerolineae bacterium]
MWGRGYVLLRQELASGRRTWLVHGSLWAGFHAFNWWDLISLLPLYKGVSYVLRWLKNNTPALVMHDLQKAGFFFVVVPLFLYGGT